MTGYRGIRPILAFDSPDHPDPLNLRQFIWEQCDGDEREVAWFAGQQMAIYQHQDGRYMLTYLNLAYPMRFASTEEAKATAPDFARAVLLDLLAELSVEDDEPELQRCLRSFGLWGDDADD